LLQEMACSQFQGFGLSRPLDEEAMRQRLCPV